MKNLFNIVLVSTTLLASTSLAMSQEGHDRMTRSHGGEIYAQDYRQFGSQTGPYLAPKRMAQSQRRPAVLPFTWEEKRAFERDSEDQI